MEIPVIKKDIENISINRNELEKVYKLLQESSRPLIIAGNGIKLGKCVDKLKIFLDKHQIPVVVTILATDVIENDNDLYCGKLGLIGDRAGNFTLQNCDLLISLGCRMAQGVIGYRKDWFAREAKVIYIDNDLNELEKNNINYSLKLNMDLNLFFENYNYDKKSYSDWLDKCLHWKKKWLFERVCFIFFGVEGVYVCDLVYVVPKLSAISKLNMTSQGRRYK
jgi:acetolactate synthase-1/2/3 large subunit